MIEELAKIIEENVRGAAEGKEVAIAFSGGIDSTTLAFLSKRYAKDVHLYTIANIGSEDFHFSLMLSKKLGLKHDVFTMSKEEAGECYKHVKGRLPWLNFVKADVLTPVEKLLRVVVEKTVLFGSCTEELFYGYDRYYVWLEEGLSEEEINKRLEEEYAALFKGGDVDCIKQLAEEKGKEVLFPFCDEKIKKIMFSVSPKERGKDKERKKYYLREVAKLLGVPREAIERRKKAMQYGSGSHKLIMKLKKENEIE